MSNTDLITAVFSGYYSRSITGMVNCLVMAHDYKRPAAVATVQGWIDSGAIVPTHTNDTHYITAKEAEKYS